RMPINTRRSNQFGDDVSDPIREDYTFFMLGYEGMRSVIERAGTAIVLTPEQRHGDFSAVTTPIIDPLTGNPFLGNIIPQNRLNSVSANLINNYMPLPNVAGAVNYAGVTRDIVDINQGLA